MYFTGTPFGRPRCSQWVHSTKHRPRLKWTTRSRPRFGGSASSSRPESSSGLGFSAWGGVKIFPAKQAAAGTGTDSIYVCLSRPVHGIQHGISVAEFVVVVVVVVVFCILQTLWVYYIRIVFRAGLHHGPWSRIKEDGWPFSMVRLLTNWILQSLRAPH
jgi:hypothetical protein